MWHASIAGRYGWKQWAVLEEIAAQELKGVGDRGLGEWREQGEKAFHLRRRLTAHEMTYGGIASVCDVRQTEEHALRVDRMRPFLPPQMRALPVEAFP